MLNSQRIWLLLYTKKNSVKTFLSKVSKVSKDSTSSTFFTIYTSYLFNKIRVILILDLTYTNLYLTRLLSYLQVKVNNILELRLNWDKIIIKIF